MSRTWEFKIRDYLLHVREKYNLPMEWLLSWDVTAWIVGLAVPLAFGFAVAEDFKLARVFFLLAAADAIGGIAMWGTKTDLPLWAKILIVFVSAGVVGVLTMLSLKYVDHKEADKREKELPKSVEQRSAEFSISEPRMMINMKRDIFASLPIWVRYPTSLGDTISPVAIAMFIDITSHVPQSERISRYSVAVHTDACGWWYLSPIRMNGVKAYWVYNGIKKSAPLDFTKNGLDYLLEQDIPAHGTVSGWWFFDTKLKCDAPVGELVQFRVEFDTFSGKHFEKVTERKPISTQGPPSGTSEASMTGMHFIFPGGGTEDLSGLKVKFYSDEH
jgi:hypothetical protein